MRRIIYLDGANPCVDEDHITFPTGEQHIRIRHSGPCSITLVSNDPSGGLMKIGMAVDICRRNGVKDITLMLPFVPYARQDEVYVDGDPLSIKVFADFLNSLHLDKVIIADPHSKVTPALINNVQVIPQHQVVAPWVMKFDSMVIDPLALVAPDIGAEKKVKALQLYLKKHYGITFPTIQGNKVRDPETGKITGFQVLAGDPRGHHCVMIDDICDGGGTFLGLGNVLMEQGANAMSLYVTHGIFSKGVEVLLHKFDYIAASDSFPHVDGVMTIKTAEIGGLR